MNAVLQLLVLCGVSAAAAGGTYLVKGPPVRTVTIVCDPKTLQADEVCLSQVVEPVIWIDARERHRWTADGLPGSLLWDPTGDESTTEAAVAEKLVDTPDAKVVVYCSTEACGVSRQVAKKIARLELASEVKVLRGGWDALKAGGRIKDSNGAR